MIPLARVLVRLVSFVLLVLLALGGLALAVFSIDAGTTGPSLARLASLLQLDEVRNAVGDWLGRMEADGPIALIAALCGLGAVLAGLVLLVGLLVPRRERLIVVSRDGEGELAVRRRPLAQVAQALAEQVRGVTEARAKARPGRRAGGRLRMRVTRGPSADPHGVHDEVAGRLGELTEPLGIATRVEVTRPRARVE
ncbi:MAG TPA: hypothetical protein VGM91_00935 [Conexibacter sp.]